MFGFLGVTDGEVTRILTNFTTAFVLALLLVLAAAVVGGVVPALDEVLALRYRLGLLCLGFVLLVAGLVWLAVLAARSGTENERPRISANLAEPSEGRGALSAKVDAGGLTVDEHLIVTVTGKPSTESAVETFLYGARVGPDAAGDAGHSLALPLDARRHGAVDIRAQLVPRAPPSLKRVAEGSPREEGCNEESRLLACVTVSTPRR